MSKELIIRNILILDELKKIDNKANFEFIVFKGAGLIINGIYKISERQMSDVDLFIKKSDKNNFLSILTEMGYSEIKNGENSFYKIILSDFPPVVIDLHTEFFGFSFYDVSFVDLDGYRNLKVLSDEDMFLFLVIHSVLNHAFFDEKTKNDLKYILKRNQNSEFLKRIIIKSERYGYSYLLVRVLNRFGFKFRTKIGFRELISLPFLEISLKKHFVLNEYVLLLIYKPKKLIEFIKKPSKFKNIFLRFLGKMD